MQYKNANIILICLDYKIMKIFILLSVNYDMVTKLSTGHIVIANYQSTCQTCYWLLYHLHIYPVL
jgi:hypothetical protein